MKNFNRSFWAGIVFLLSGFVSACGSGNHIEEHTPIKDTASTSIAVPQDPPAKNKLQAPSVSPKPVTQTQATLTKGDATKEREDDSEPEAVPINNLVINGWTDRELKDFQNSCDKFTQLYTVPNTNKFCSCMKKQSINNLEEFKYEAKTCLGIGGGF